MLADQNHKVTIGGELAALQLKEWWSYAFTDEERRRITDLYQPIGAPKTLLVEGDFYYKERPLHFLLTLAGWLDGSKDRNIARKVILKAEEYVPSETNVLDLHFFWETKMRFFYKDRANAASLQEAATASLKQIEISADAAEAFHKRYQWPQLPVHEGYDHLCIIYEKQGKFEDAIKLAEQAKQQGWGGDWDGRIQRCKRKIEKSMGKVTS